jgi:hypothetical protein
MNWMDFPNDGFCVHGLAWFEEDRPALRRLPARLKDTFRPPVWDLAQCPAGGRIMFATDSAHVGIRAKSPDYFVMNHITRIGQSGFDVYVDGNFMGSVSPDPEGKIEAQWQIQKEAGKVRNITIHMPLYKSVTLEQIGLDEGAAIKGHKEFAIEKPVVYYGTSITQGGCASTPGTTYQNFVSRALNVDFINLGFSGNGLGEPELARAINEIDCSCLVIDHWANKGKDYRENLPVFIGELRKVHKTEPIIVMGPFFYTRDAIDDSLHVEQRKAGQEYVKQMNDEGDRNMYFFDGRKMITPETAFGLVDGAHPNSLGFYLMAQAFTPFLKKVLKL